MATFFKNTEHVTNTPVASRAGLFYERYIAVGAPAQAREIARQGKGRLLLHAICIAHADDGIMTATRGRMRSDPSYAHG